MQQGSNLLGEAVPPANPGLQLTLAQLLGQNNPPPAAGPPSARLGSLQAPGPGERGAAGTLLGGFAGLQPQQAGGFSGLMLPGGYAPPPQQQQVQLQQLQQLQQQQQQMQQQQAGMGAQSSQLSAALQWQLLAAQQAAMQRAAAAGQVAQQQQAANPLAGFAGLPTANSAAAASLAAQSMFAQYTMPTAAYARQGEPPAKRQAMDPATARHLHLQQQLTIARQAIMQNPALQNHPQYAPYAAILRKLGQLGNSGAMTNNMRVAIDKRAQRDYDATFVAEDTTAKEHADEVMRRCEETTAKLRAALGKYSGKGAEESTDDRERFGATTEEGGEAGGAGYAQVSQAQLMEACGDTARFLKPYQIVGVNFLMLLYRVKVGGAILADEMGLGKTAQLITYLGAIRMFASDPGPHLVVVPASLLENWQRELRRWCPDLKVVVYYGKHRAVVRRRLLALKEKLAAGQPVDDDLSDLADPDLLAELAAENKAAELQRADAEEDGGDGDPLGLGILHESDDEFDLQREQAGDELEAQPEESPASFDMNAVLPKAPFDVMLTCYTLFERDSPEQRLDRGFLEKWRWSHLVMDEAHALKNRNASRTMRLRRVAAVAKRRIMMTGTPLQNDLAELQNLLHFLLPTVFAAQGFEDLMEMLQGDDTEIAKLTDRMKSLLGPFVLRRLKTEVAGQLTSKTHRTELVEMTREQSALYQESVQSMRNQITGRAAAASSDRSEKGVEKLLRSLGAKKISHMFTHLRKIAQHPLLIRANFSDEMVAEVAEKAFALQLFSGAASQKRVHEELLTYSDFALHAFCYNHGAPFAQFLLRQEHLMASTKFQYMAELLPRLKAAGSRPLIFSQWTAVLDIMEWLMEVLRLPYVRLDGSTAVDERLATVDRFNTSASEDVFAFLLSTRAGGQGLNLTGADTVILHDVDFNPQIDRQAEDRCHRLGQTKPVTVYRLITRGTVDQNIYALSQRKLKLDSAVLDGITSGSGRTSKADEKQQMGFILHSLLSGAAAADEDSAPKPEPVEAKPEPKAEPAETKVEPAQNGSGPAVAPPQQQPQQQQVAAPREPADEQQQQQAGSVLAPAAAPAVPQPAAAPSSVQLPFAMG